MAEQMTYKVGDIHKIEIAEVNEEFRTGFAVTLFEKMGSRWVALGAPDFYPQSLYPTVDAVLEDWDISEE